MPDVNLEKGNCIEYHPHDNCYNLCMSSMLELSIPCGYNYGDNVLKSDVNEEVKDVQKVFFPAKPKTELWLPIT